MRTALSDHIRATKDLGFFIPTSRENVVLYDKVRKEKYPLNELYNLVDWQVQPMQMMLPYSRKHCPANIPKCAIGRPSVWHNSEPKEN